MNDRSTTTEGAGYLLTILVLLSLVLFVAGGILVLRSAHGFTLLAGAVLVAIFAHMVQASAHHRELVEGLGEVGNRGQQIRPLS